MATTKLIGTNTIIFNLSIYEAQKVAKGRLLRNRVNNGVSAKRDHHSNNSGHPSCFSSQEARTSNKHNMETGTLLYIFIIKNLGTEHRILNEIL